MKTNISVLWIEDMIQWLEPMEEQITNHLNTYGISLNIKKCSNIQEAHAEVSKKLDHKYDFIFVDYNLDKLNTKEEGITGAGLITTLRTENRFVEVIFYSNAPDFRESLSRQVDGVFTVDRAGFYLKSKELIDYYIEKVINVASVRNHIISEVAHIDKIFVEMLSDIFMKHPKFKDEFFEKTAENSSKRCSTFHSSLSKYKAMSQIEEIFALLISSKFQSEDYRTGVQRIKNNLKTFDEYQEDLKKYADVLLKRNLYAHCVVEDREGKKILVNHNPKKDDEFTVKESVEFAKSVEAFKARFLELKTKFESV